jgi:hypothetical protein
VCTAAARTGPDFVPCFVEMTAAPAILLFCFFLTACAGASSGQARAAAATDPDMQAQAVRQALLQSVDMAVNRLGRADGYWANPQVRIPLPEELRRAEKVLRRYGLERYTEDFAESLNRAAEAAVPVAKPLLLAAVRDMSLGDAAGMVRGDEDAATRYFRAHTDAALRARLKPIVAEATARANVTAAYKRLMKKAAFLEKAVEPGRLDLDAYVTHAALDGLYLLMAQEERRIRRNPLARTTDLLKKVFR